MSLTSWEDMLPIWNMPNGSLRFAIADLISFAYRKNHQILYIWGWFICCIMLPYRFHKIFDKLYHRKCYWCLAKEKDLSLKPFWICNFLAHELQWDASWYSKQTSIAGATDSTLQPRQSCTGRQNWPLQQIMLLTFFVSNLPALKPLPTCH
jgi:hypothetical protein